MGGLSAVLESSLVKKVASVAPLLGSVLGSPLAGIAISLLANVFGVDPKDTTALSNAIATDPEASLKIKKLEYDHQEALQNIASQDFSNEVKDKQDARRYGGEYKYFLMAMCVIVTGGFFGCLFLLFYSGMNLNEIEKQLLSLLIGMLASKWQTIIDFFYGASRYQGGIK